MKFINISIFLSLFLVLGAAGLAHARESGHKGRFDHVLLLSVDGMHAIDVENYITAHPDSNLASLAANGVRYTGASTSKPSDSFPGLLSMVTGGSPKSGDVFYDVSYDRLQFAPSNSTCSGIPGNQSTYDESIDLLDSMGVDQNVIDVSKLPYALDTSGNCALVWPHNFVKVNTIFEVVKANGGTTAWADKHPAYDLVNGPSGKGVDDLYTPEITVPGGFDSTVSVECTAANDNLKVLAILNEIDGYKSTDNAHSNKIGTPTVFGMNFQAVSVGQKLTSDSNATCPVPILSLPTVYGMTGGYTDAAGTPTAVLDYGLKSVDDALGSMIQELKTQGIFNSTLMIVSAKHGQAPIDFTIVNKPGHLEDLVAALPDGGTNPAALAIVSAANPNNTPGGGGISEDDVALIWLNDQDQSQAEAVADYLRKNQAALYIRKVLAGESLREMYRNPLKDNRTPDVVVIPNLGTIYTSSTVKHAEHGGFSTDDTNVGLVASAPRFTEKVIRMPVLTTQIAPTILEALGYNPRSLDAVRKEHTSDLPGFGR